MNGLPRLLLVDDDALNREVALGQLVELGLGADVASDGAMAVAMAGARPYDLILMDIQMPVLDGYEATRRILAQPGRRQTPIVALTANPLPECRSACLAAGMVDYLEKPVATSRLRSCLASWLPGGFPATPAPAAAGAGSLFAALRAAGGFDPDIAVNTLGVKPERYPALLLKYLYVHEQTVAQAGCALQDGNLEVAKRLVHTLKGTAATLGLEATRDAAAKLDRQLGLPADGQTTGALYRALAETDRQQQETLRRLLAD